MGVGHGEVSFLVDFLEAFQALFDGCLGLNFYEGLNFFFFAVVWGVLIFWFWVAVREDGFVVSPLVIQVAQVRAG